MYKQEFIKRLRIKLSALPKWDVEERVSFYSEMIDDRMEDGTPETVAVAQIGSADEIARQTLLEYYQMKYQKRRAGEKRRLKAWEIVLLVLGSPIWLSFLIAAVAVALSLYAVLWSVVVCLWAAFAALAGSMIGGVIGGIVFCFLYDAMSGLLVISGGIVCAGLAIFAFFACKAATKGAVWLTVQGALAMKKCFVGRGRA